MSSGKLYDSWQDLELLSIKPALVIADVRFFILGLYRIPLRGADEMTNQRIGKEPIKITQPILATREDFELFVQRTHESKSSCHKVQHGDGWSCKGKCAIGEVCVPQMFHDPLTHEIICWCECMQANKLPELLVKAEAIKAQWPSVPDTNYIPPEPSG